MEVDIVTVFHRESYRDMANDLRAQLSMAEPHRFKFIAVNNMVENRGFAAGCNHGAARGDSPIIGLLNPDAIVRGPFLDKVQATLDGTCVITGMRYGKTDGELAMWGVRDWVCGAVMFVEREFWEKVGGFDERFWMFFEETDLCRQAEQKGYEVKSIELPIEHVSPDVDVPEDAQIKRDHMTRSGVLYYEKWGR